MPAVGLTPIQNRNVPLCGNPPNAENRIAVPKVVRYSLTIASKAVVGQIVALVRKHRRRNKQPITTALQGWYGVPWQKIASALTRATPPACASYRSNNAHTKQFAGARLSKYDLKHLILQR